MLWKLIINPCRYWEFRQAVLYISSSQRILSYLQQLSLISLFSICLQQGWSGMSLNIIEKVDWYSSGDPMFQRRELWPLCSLFLIPRPLAAMFFFFFFIPKLNTFSKRWQLLKLCLFFWNTAFDFLSVPCSLRSKHRTFHICFPSFLTIRLPYFDKHLTLKE